MFQFPTGWNSTHQRTTTIPPSASFNSQRDGILPLHIRAQADHRRFQFPTGWNSTICRQLRKIYVAVSIPNGMEFYASAIAKSGAKGEVSIPNGMEFYRRNSLLQPRKCSSFNSQRDGILRYWILFLVSVASRFQFPTGWNSTARFALLPRQFKFQFPTGWNSTQK